MAGIRPPDAHRRPPARRCIPLRDAFERALDQGQGRRHRCGRTHRTLSISICMAPRRPKHGEGETLAACARCIDKDLPLVFRSCQIVVGALRTRCQVSTWPASHHRPRLWKAPCTVAEDEDAFCKSVPAIAVPDPDLLAIGTNDQPTRGIYEKLQRLKADTVPTLSFAPGFPAADFRCGPSVFAYGRTQADADAAADKIVALVESLTKTIFHGRIIRP